MVYIVVIIALVPLSLIGAFLTREYFEGFIFLASRDFVGMRRFRETKLRSKPFGDAILDDVEGQFYDQCSWNPLSGHSFSRTCVRKQDGAMLASMDIFKETSLALDPGAIKNEGCLSSTLLHLTHNTIAIIATFVILIVSIFKPI